MSLLALLAGGAFVWLSLSLPGSGAVFQDAPERVVSGQTFEITVQAATWGSGGPAHQRYRDVRLQPLLNDEALGPEVAPLKTSRDGDRVRFVFQLKAPGRDAADRRIDNTAELRWRLRFALDGQPHEVPGTQSIQIDR